MAAALLPAERKRKPLTPEQLEERRRKREDARVKRMKMMEEQERKRVEEKRRKRSEHFQKVSSFAKLAQLRDGIGKSVVTRSLHVCVWYLEHLQVPMG